MKKRVLAAIMTAAMICTGLAGCGGNASGSTDASGKAEKKTKITIAVPDPEASYIYQAAQEFADRASEYSDGTLEFTVPETVPSMAAIPLQVSNSSQQVPCRC